MDDRREPSLGLLPSVGDLLVEGIAVLDTSLCCHYMNQTMAQLLGVATQPTQGGEPKAIPCGEELLAELRQAVKTLQSNGNERDPVKVSLASMVQSALRSPTSWLSTARTGNGSDAGPWYIWSIGPALETGEKPAQWLNISRLVSLGELTAMVLHEIMNPLTVILGKSQGLADLIDDRSENAEALRESQEFIYRAAQRMRKVFEHTRNISRQTSDDDPEEVQIKALIEDDLEFIQPRLQGTRIRLTHEIPDSLLAFCRPMEISQIVLNLVGNSIDALEGDQDPWIKVTAVFAQDRVIIRFIDSGEGIAPAIQSQIMSRFFTSKATGEGTGVGLYLSKTIAERNQGTLYLDPDSSNTTFVLELPTPPEAE